MKGIELEIDINTIFRKILIEKDLTIEEVEELLYRIECENESLFKILCVIHLTISTGVQADLDSLLKVLEQWAEEEKIK